MAAPRIIRRIFCFQPTRPNLFTLVFTKKHGLANHTGSDSWYYNKSQALLTAGYLRRLERLYSQSSQENTSSSGKAPLKKPYTPVGKYDGSQEKHRDAEKEPLEAFPDDVNPITGEKGGPRGPEPTRYGDWERKGRCIDF